MVKIWRYRTYCNGHHCCGHPTIKILSLHQSNKQLNERTSGKLKFTGSAVRNIQMERAREREGEKMPVPVDVKYCICMRHYMHAYVPGIDDVLFCPNQNLVNKSCFPPLAARR